MLSVVNNSVFFNVTIWEKIKPGSDSPKEGSQMLSLAIFGISDALERVMKIVINVGQFIYTDSMVFHLFASCAGD